MVAKKRHPLQMQLMSRDCGVTDFTFYPSGGDSYRKYLHFYCQNAIKYDGAFN
jgi:hypothetical protein